jgi:hypothetical protein
MPSDSAFSIGGATVGDVIDCFEIKVGRSSSSFVSYNSKHEFFLLTRTSELSKCSLVVIVIYGDNDTAPCLKCGVLSVDCLIKKVCRM